VLGRLPLGSKGRQPLTGGVRTGEGRPRDRQPAAREFQCPHPPARGLEAAGLGARNRLEEVDTAPFRDRYGPNSAQVTPQAVA
jgi:hypothetical protein